MLKHVLSALVFLVAPSVFAEPRPVHAREPQLKVMMIFAHPDEGEKSTPGGAAILYTQMRHTVRFLSITNGDAGHYSMKPEDLAKRRYQEAMEAKRIIGLAGYQVLDYHDGNLQDTPCFGTKVAERIQHFEWMIFSYDSADGGHNDNMSAGRIVRGAVPLLKMAKMPVVFYVRDYFTTGLSHVPHVAISIDSVWKRNSKPAALMSRRCSSPTRTRWAFWPRCRRARNGRAITSTTTPTTTVR